MTAYTCRLTESYHSDGDDDLDSPVWGPYIRTVALDAADIAGVEALDVCDALGVTLGDDDALEVWSDDGDALGFDLNLSTPDAGPGTYTRISVHVTPGHYYA
jgi:hypothetical protein